MSQTVDFNWAVKVKDYKKAQDGSITAIIKNGVRIFPLYDSCGKTVELLDWNKKVCGHVKIKKIEIKPLRDITEENAHSCGFKSIHEITIPGKRVYYCRREYNDNHSSIF
jgi:hypothetical protein